MNKPTVQDIFQRFYPAYLERYSPSPEQAKAARNIINCKTGAYGANVSICEDCGAVHIHYNSCRNRCCPMCQAVPKEKWMDARRSASATIRELTEDPEHLGAKVGYIFILHTWGSEMNFQSRFCMVNDHINSICVL